MTVGWSENPPPLSTCPGPAPQSMLATETHPASEEAAPAVDLCLHPGPAAPQQWEVKQVSYL
jgi:hypothetical protein